MMQYFLSTLAGCSESDRSRKIKVQNANIEKKKGKTFTKLSDQLNKTEKGKHKTNESKKKEAAIRGNINKTEEQETTERVDKASNCFLTIDRALARWTTC